jgi:hypothetical protein
MSVAKVAHSALSAAAANVCSPKFVHLKRIGTSAEPCRSVAAACDKPISSSRLSRYTERLTAP